MYRQFFSFHDSASFPPTERSKKRKTKVSFIYFMLGYRQNNNIFQIIIKVQI